MKSIVTKSALALLVLAAAGVVLWLFGGELHRIVMQAKAWTAEQGAWAWVLFLVVFIAFSCVMIPDSFFAIAGGALFGLVGGIGVVLIGATMARMVQFGLARRFLRARVQRYVEARPRLSRVGQAVLRDQFRLQIMIRLTPLNFTLGSYLFASIGVGFSPYLKALIGTLPLHLVMVYIGAEGANVAEMGARSGGDFGVEDALKILGLVVSGVVLTVITRIAIREVRAAVGEPAEA